MRRSFGRCHLVLTALLCVSASFVAAQVIVDPRVVEFEPSPDHDAVGVNGQPLVTRYELEFYLGSASTPFATIPLGKPAPDPDGFIRANSVGPVSIR